MRVVIRADASPEIGTGHVMRCLTLAETLSAAGATVRFVCRSRPGDLSDFIAERGFPVHRLETPGRTARESCNAKLQWLGVSIFQDMKDTAAAVAGSVGRCEWLVVDHYGLDAVWEEKMREVADNIMVIDDLADRPHCSDLLLDTGHYANAMERYRHLVPSSCGLLLGPRYAMLRDEFRDARTRPRERDGSVRRILISFGGADPTNETAKCLEALTRVSPMHLEADIVVGRSNQRHRELKERAASLHDCRLHSDVRDMAGLMFRADLAIGAGGTTTWERILMGLPSLVIVVADNQADQARSLTDKGYLVNLGPHTDVTPAHIAQALSSMSRQPAVLRRLSILGIELMADWVGATGVRAAMEERSYVHA